MGQTWGTRRPSCGVEGVVAGFTCVDVLFGDSVEGLGNKRAILDERVTVERIWPASAEFHECKRDPVVAFLDNAGFAENRLVQNDIMRVAVGVLWHDAPPMLCGFGLWVDLESGRDSVCGSEVATSCGIPACCVQEQAAG